MRLPMPRALLLRLAMAGLMAALLWACAKAPYTDRTQFIIVPRSTEMGLGESAAKDILKKEKQSTNQEYVALTERVGKRIAAVSDAPSIFKWEFHVIEKPDTVNAFCLPGGKVFVYTGLFKVATTEDDLATVLAHEVSHAIARHGVERMSQAEALSLGGAVAGAAVGVSGGAAASKAFQAAYGMGANVGILLPFSRTHEYEADHIGLILMAKAGYDPHKALDFWTKMAENSKKQGQKAPEYLATHPSDQHRIDEIRKELPEALGYYKGPRG
jgi:metalloendopeptidase OMA1, mitochondrial